MLFGVVIRSKTRAYVAWSSRSFEGVERLTFML